MATTNEFKVGDKVVFGRTFGEQTNGTVVGIGRTGKLKVRQDESRGVHKIGAVWTVPVSLCRLASASAPAVAPMTSTDSLALKVGQTVEFQGYSWAARGTATLTGVVTRVAQGAYEVYGNGQTQVLQYTAIKAVTKRPFETVKSEISGVYGSLSPENLWSDGEATRTEANRRRACLNRALAALFVEVGRKVSEAEAFAL